MIPKQDMSSCAGEEGGKTCSDTALLLTQYRGAIRRYGNEKM